MDIGSHDNVTFIEKYFRNYTDKRKRLWLGIGNTKPIYNYFIQMQIENSSFFYMIDVEDKALIKNLLWTDTKSKVAYEEFSDVVTFDTINLTNKYDMPFSPFVDMHGQLICMWVTIKWRHYYIYFVISDLINMYVPTCIKCHNYRLR